MTLTHDECQCSVRTLLHSLRCQPPSDVSILTAYSIALQLIACLSELISGWQHSHQGANRLDINRSALSWRRLWTVSYNQCCLMFGKIVPMDKQSFQHQFPNQFSHPFPPLLCYQKYDISYCNWTLPLNLKTQRRFSRFTAVNHYYGDNRPTTKIHKTTKWIPITEYKHDLFTPLS